MPDYFRSLFGGRTDNRLLRLVLDGILEVEHEGAFVSGPGARKFLIGEEAYSGKGRIAALSIEALRYVEALGDLTIPEMTRRLYGFGRRPVTSAQKRAFRSCRDRHLQWLPGRAPSPRQILGPRAVRECPLDHVASNPEQGRWRTGTIQALCQPRAQHVAEAFAASAEILGQSAGVRGLKLGRGLPGLTRPDKLVAYFSRLDDLQEAGARLHRRLGGCPVHGVPFTAELSPDGLLSWGADPPRTAPGQPESWRLWIAGSSRRISRQHDEVMFRAQCGGSRSTDFASTA